MTAPFVLTPERWKHVQALFHEALHLPEEERDAYLDHACDDPLLRQEVDALLKAHAAPAAIFERDPEALVADLEAASGDPIGRKIGPYRIVRALGRGGMGAVYLARREDIDKQVAIKVVHDVLASPERIQRFLLERRVLARLDHPGIAHILDAGMTDEGAPYFAMEYVEGLSITDYCDRNRLGVTARLHLFLRICAAVQDAHRNLIVHRDLKPSNILVMVDGTVKLLDFGIAKLLAEEPGRAALTQTGTGMMTPAYAAPEQILGKDVTTATDVYALGLLLYELLTGRLPYTVEGRPAHEIGETVLRTMPRKPSTAVVAAEDVATLRATTAERLHRRLQGDLDTICLTALQKDPSHRYAFASDFLADVERHLEGLPVTARPDTLGYRLSKFAYRHRVPVTVSGAVLLVLFSLTVLYMVQLREQRNRERAEAEKARQVSAFLINLFEASDPFATDTDSLDVRTLLQRGTERIEALADQPDVQAQMFDVLGQVYVALSQYPEAEELLRKALALRRHPGSDDPGTARTLMNLGTLFVYTGAYDSAEVALRDALGLLERQRPAPPQDLAEALDNLGIVLNQKSNYKEAEGFLRRALQIRRALHDKPHKDLGTSLNDLAVNLYYQGDYAAAEPYYREALAVDRAVLGAEHPDIATDLANLGKLLEEKGQYTAAESLLTEALRVRRAALGNEHYDTALSLTQLGGMLQRKGDYDRAEAYLRESMTIRERLLGPAHPGIATTLNALALTLRDRGDYDEAERLLRRVVDIYRTSLGDRHRYTAVGLCNLAQVLHLKANHEEAERSYREGLSILEAVHPADHWELAYNRSRFGALLADQGHFAEAEPLLLESYATLNAHYGTDHAQTRDAARRLAALYEAWNKPDQAAPYRLMLSSAEKGDAAGASDP